MSERRKPHDCGGRREIARIPAELILYETRGESYIVELHPPTCDGESAWFGIGVPHKEVRIPASEIEDYCDRMNWFDVVKTIKAGKGVCHAKG